MTPPASTHLAVKNFERFQHYRNRHPPWIKLYSDLLMDQEFLQLPEGAQAQLMKLWILASQLGHPLPNNARLLAGKIGATGRFHLPELIASGFLVPCTQSASDALANPEMDASALASTNGDAVLAGGASKPLAEPLAKRKQNASAPRARIAPSRERSEVREQRTATTPHSTARAVPDSTVAPDALPEFARWPNSTLATRLATDVDRAALGVMLGRVPEPETWLAELTASLDGMPGHCLANAEQLGEAIRDWVGNGAAENPSLRQLRRYVESAAHPAYHSPYRNGGPSKSGGARNDAALDRFAAEDDGHGH